MLARTMTENKNNQEKTHTTNSGRPQNDITIDTQVVDGTKVCCIWHRIHFRPCCNKCIQLTRHGHCTNFRCLI